MKTRRGLVALAAAGLMALGGAAAPAMADEPIDANQAELVFESVYFADDQEAAMEALSAEDRELFDAWVTPIPVQVTTTYSPVKVSSTGATAAAAAACSSYTQRGQFNNQVGLKLGDFWTTGQVCRSGSTVSSVSYLDGGGRTSALGWSYVGRTTGKGIQSNVGFVYGSYKFKLNIAGIDVQQPSYCARTIHTSGASMGDLRCGIG